nr:palmitoyltransferase akr1 [Quercus suber]
MESFTLASTVLVSSLLLYFMYIVGLSIYRLLLHPLASFPGPRLAALTFAYETFFDVFVAPGGQFTYELDRLHDIYGPVIRINPDEIHVRESTFFDTLYAGPGHRRDKWERANRANASPGSVASAVSHDLHRARRAAINPFFSKRAITQLESGVRERVERLVARLHTDYAGTDRVVDIGAAFTAVTFDVISEYCFDDCYNVLDEPDFGPRWKALMGGLFEAVPVTKQFPIVARIMAALPSWLVQKLMPDMEVFMGLKLQIDKKVREVYAEYRTSSHASASQVPAKTLFDGIMQSTLPPSEKSVERLSDESFVLLVAGGETTARVMTVIIAQLIENSSLLARLREELDSVMEKELPPSRILEELPLLKAVIQEGNRFATPVTNRPILRAPDENLTTKDGWVIPRNLFDPNRWLGSERLDRYLVTFSKGTRSCVGINLAYAEMYLGIAAVVRNFDFEFFDFDQKRDLDVVRDCFIGLPSKESRGVRVKKICRRRGRRVQPQACKIPARTPALPRVNAYCYVDFCAPRSPSLGKRKIKQCDTGDTYSSTIVPLSALLDMAGSQESELANIQSPSLGTGKDGLDKVELSDLDASPPPLPVEQDLMQLARLGELRSIQKLFDSGRFTARSTDEQGITALHSGADVNAIGGDAQATPVLWASKRCHLPVVSLLLANGADPLLRDDQGYNLLHSATLDGNVFQLILLLHQPDLPVDVPDVQGHTSLMWAAYKGFPACVDVLLRWGADVHATDDSGLTALHWALVKGSYGCAQKLVEYGSDRFARSKPVPPETEGDTPAMTASKMKSERQWRKALADSGYNENGEAMEFPLPYVKNKRSFFWYFFFFWPFALGGLQLWMLANMLVWISIPSVFLVGYALQYLVQKTLYWAPADMKHMHRTPFLAGIFAATLFWVGQRYVFHMLPWTIQSHPYLNFAFTASYLLCLYFYVMTMTADPGYIPKGNSRGQTKMMIDELVEHNAFDEIHFCTQCMIRKPLRSKHCKRCGRCVAREDHVLPEPAQSEQHCAILKQEFCAEYSKDPLTIVTNAWGSLQLTWTFMLLFVHLTQVARNITTYETMRGVTQASPLMTAITAGTMSVDGAQVDNAGAGPKPHAHGQKKKEGCMGQWFTLLGVDTFITIAFQGYKGSQSKAEKKRQARRENLFSRGVFRNCIDFWADGPIFGRKANCHGKLGGQEIDYAVLWDVPQAGMRYRAGGYEEVSSAEEGIGGSRDPMDTLQHVIAARPGGRRRSPSCDPQPVARLAPLPDARHPPPHGQLIAITLRSRYIPGPCAYHTSYIDRHELIAAVERA